MNEETKGVIHEVPVAGETLPNSVKPLGAVAQGQDRNYGERPLECKRGQEVGPFLGPGKRRRKLGRIS